MRDPDSIPDVPATHYLDVELVEDLASFGDRFTWWTKSALKALFLQFEAEGDPRRNTKLLVRDRWTGEVVYTQEWLHDPNGAVVAKGMIESDLERLGIKDFLGEYSIYWTPPHAGGDPDPEAAPVRFDGKGDGSASQSRNAFLEPPPARSEIPELVPMTNGHWDKAADSEASCSYPNKRRTAASLSNRPSRNMRPESVAEGRVPGPLSNNSSGAGRQRSLT